MPDDAPKPPNRPLPADGGERAPAPDPFLLEPPTIGVLAPEDTARSFAGQLRSFLRLTRLSGAVAAIGNAWFVVLWTRGMGDESVGAVTTLPLIAALAAAALNALALFGFGAALNDVLDLRRDRVLRPERPLPSGNVSVEAATLVVSLTLLAAVLGALPFGVPSVLVTLITAGAILFFNILGKFVPGVGLLALGLIYAGQMLVPNPAMIFLWPVWLVMTHALLIAYVAHRLGRRVPRISGRAMTAAVLGWIAWSSVLLAWSLSRQDAEISVWPEGLAPLTAFGPIALAVGVGLLIARKIKTAGSNARAAEKTTRYGSFVLVLYNAAWLFGAGLGSAWLLVALFAAGAIGAAGARELLGLIENPASYKR